MIKYLLILTLFFFSFNVFSADNSKRISNIQNLLSKSIDESLFSVKKDRSKPNLLRIELDQSLNEEYKNSLHLWLVDASKTNPNLKNIFLTRKPSAPIFTRANILNGSITIFLLLSFLLIVLKQLSNRRSLNSNDNYEEILTKKIEQKVESIISKPSRTIDYL